MKTSTLFNSLFFVLIIAVFSACDKEEGTHETEYSYPEWFESAVKEYQKEHETGLAISTVKYNNDLYYRFYSIFSSNSYDGYFFSHKGKKISRGDKLFEELHSKGEVLYHEIYGTYSDKGKYDALLASGHPEWLVQAIKDYAKEVELVSLELIEYNNVKYYRLICPHSSFWPNGIFYVQSTGKKITEKDQIYMTLHKEGKVLEFLGLFK